MKIINSKASKLLSEAGITINGDKLFGKLFPDSRGATSN